MTRTEQELIDAWNDGDIDISDADTIDDLDGFTVQAKFECEDGFVILTYDLDVDSAYRSDPEGGSREVNILEESSVEVGSE